jgi:ribosomal protein S18 acetylase RimI-like enzyme
MKETLLVRPARHSELAQLARIDVEVFGPGGYPAFFFRQAADVFEDLLQVGELRPTGEVVGYALGALASCSDRGWILSAAVRPEHRGHGIATELAGRVLEYLAMRGAAEVRLAVEPGNEAGLRLYRRLGFAVVEEENDYYGPDESRLVMSWRP